MKGPDEPARQGLGAKPVQPEEATHEEDGDRGRDLRLALEPRVDGRTGRMDEHRPGVQRGRLLQRRLLLDDDSELCLNPPPGCEGGPAYPYPSE
jgi:hypothetical protein